MNCIDFLSAADQQEGAAGADEYQDGNNGQEAECFLASLLRSQSRVAWKRGLRSRYNSSDHRGADRTCQLLQCVDHGIAVCIQCRRKLAQSVGHSVPYRAALPQCKEYVKADAGKDFKPS